MKSIRISIARLMGLVVLLALGLAALKHPTRLSASAIYSAMLVILLTTATGTLVCTGRSRASCVGFLIFGAAFLFMRFSPWLWLNHDGLQTPDLLNEQFFDYLYTHQLAGGYINQSTSFANMTTTNVGNYRVGPAGGRPMTRVTESPIRQIFHTEIGFLFALIGAVVGRILAARTDEASASRTPMGSRSGSGSPPLTTPFQPESSPSGLVL